jgi:PD-(D/E)XK endonuclease
VGKKLASKSKGGICQALATAYFLAQHYIVSQPIYDNAPYDLVVDDGTRLLRVQCRYSSRRKPWGTTSRRRPAGYYECVDLRWGGGKGRWQDKAAWRKCTATDFDLLWVMTPTTYYLIPAAVVFGDNEQATDFVFYPKWSQYRVDYAHPGPLDPAVAGPGDSEEPPLLVVAE